MGFVTKIQEKQVSIRIKVLWPMKYCFMSLLQHVRGPELNRFLKSSSTNLHTLRKGGRTSSVTVVYDIVLLKKPDKIQSYRLYEISLNALEKP